MLNRIVLLLGLLTVSCVAGCGSGPTTASTDLTPSMEAEIKAHDADVEAAEKAHK
jgi:hypothetical protein